MAEGALRGSRADIAVAVTGIAGPGGATPDKPVGLVYFALATAGAKTHVTQRTLTLNRETFKYVASQIALDLIRRALA
jgi:PncC family amidohydrolase